MVDSAGSREAREQMPGGAKTVQSNSDDDLNANTSRSDDLRESWVGSASWGVNGVLRLGMLGSGVW